MSLIPEIPAIPQRPVVVQCEGLAQDAEAWLAARCELIACSSNDARFLDVLASARGMVVRTYTRVDQRLLAAAPNLEVIGRAGVGMDNIDLVACRERGIEVVYTPDANTQAVVEYIVTILSHHLRPRITVSGAMSLQEWRYLRRQAETKRQMSEMTLGLLGLGRVGKRVAEVMGAIGFRVIYHDLLDIDPPNRFGADPVDLEQLFADSDIISLHVDGRPTNRGFVGEPLIARLKSDVVLINTSRGFVVDSLALAAFLKRNPRSTALIDVHEPEPIEADYPLLGVSNARLYPHIASRTELAMRTMSWVVKDVIAVLEGRQPQHPAPEVLI